MVGYVDGFAALVPRRPTRERRPYVAVRMSSSRDIGEPLTVRRPAELSRFGPATTTLIARSVGFDKTDGGLGPAQVGDPLAVRREVGSVSIPVPVVSCLVSFVATFTA